MTRGFWITFLLTLLVGVACAFCGHVVGVEDGRLAENLKWLDAVSEIQSPKEVWHDVCYFAGPEISCAAIPLSPSASDTVITDGQILAKIRGSWYYQDHVEQVHVCKEHCANEFYP